MYDKTRHFRRTIDDDNVMGIETKFVIKKYTQVLKGTLLR